jgi:hypothetical protein
MKHKIDEVVQEGTGKPGIFDQLKQHTGGLLSPKDAATPSASVSNVWFAKRCR